MTSQNKPEVRLSVHNHVHDAGTDNRSISLDQHSREQMRSSKLEESSRKSIEINNGLLPIEGEIITERSSGQKVPSKMNGTGEPNRSTVTVKETSEQMDCEHTYFGASKATAAHLEEVPFMVGREEAAHDPKEAPLLATMDDGTRSSSLLLGSGSGSTVVASHSLDMILDAPETKGHTKTESTSPTPLLITTGDKNRQLSSTNPLSLPKTNQEVAFMSSQTSSSSSKLIVDSSMTDVLDTSPGHQSTSAAVASFRISDIDGNNYNNSLLRPVETHFVVVAIDFGTTMSGYAFSFVRDPSSIHMMRKWEGGDPGVINQKTPTTLLLSPEGDFHSFGFTARDFYHDLDNKEAKRWLYFEKFKMALHYNTKLNKETPITASNGKCYPAIKVFSHALRYFRDHALQELSDQSSTEILNEDIRWVITVPAIWKAPAKQFMRQAAYEAGIASPSHPDQLLIALEPEAASIYVRRLRVYQLLSSDSSSPVGGGGGRESVHLSPSKFDDASPFSLSPDPSSPATDIPRFDDPQISPENRTEVLQMNLRLFDSLPRQRTVGLDINEEGTRYMVVDCGGGTVDITVHEMEGRHGYLHELYKATGGPFGSVGVDLAFESLLTEIFGSEFIESFKTKRPAGWVDLMIAFESRKRAANPYKDNPLNISLPFSFIDYYKKTKVLVAYSPYNPHLVHNLLVNRLWYT